MNVSQQIKILIDCSMNKRYAEGAQKKEKKGLFVK